MRTIFTLLAIGAVVLTSATHSEAVRFDKAKREVKTTQCKAVEVRQKQAKTVEVKNVKCVSCPDKSCTECPPCDDCP